MLKGSILKEDTLLDALLADYEQLQNKTRAQAFTLFLLDLRKRLKQHMKTLEDFGLHRNPETNEPWQLDNRTELQDERDRYDASAQLHLYNELNREYPANEEQSNAFNRVLEAMEKAKNEQQQQFVCIHGAAGTGKSIVCQKIAAHVRSQGKLVSICASTTLAATNFENADTAHSLFAYPVQDDADDDDFDGDTLQECQLDSKAYEERLELLLQTSVIVWDEVFCNHRKLFEAAVRALHNNKTLVWVLVGDTRQPLVIVQGANDMDVIGATITSSHLWSRCTVSFLQENKRLTALQASINEHSTAEERHSATSQKQYADAILQLSEGRCENADFMCKIMQNENGCRQTSILAFPYVQHYLNTPDDCDNAVEWLHPGKDLSNLHNLRNKTILAITNERVDYWNEKIQNLNPEPPFTLLSHDYFSDVDDPKGNLASMLTETVLNSYTNTQVPNHELTLKVGDICLVTRALKASDLASNSRVLIKSISNKLAKVVTLERNPRVVHIPRIRWKFTLKHTASYSMTRVQFPLRLCYSMTTNKSQGQSMEQILLDLTDDPFSHGQTYVAWSRVRRYDKIRLIVRPNMLMESEDFETGDPIKIPMTCNVVFPSVIQRNPE
jgi:ATP-dependent DNA helicase PIF1